MQTTWPARSKKMHFMKNLAKILALLGLFLASLFSARPALAFPPLPSSFYGTVKVDGANVPDGTAVKAFVNGKVYAQALTQTYQGNSVYSLNVMGDDSSTPAVEGGIDGDSIIFRIGEEVADQTGIWKSGTNVNLDLTAFTGAPTAVPIPSEAPAVSITPGQTSMPTLPVSLKPTSSVPTTTGGGSSSAGFNKDFIFAGVILVVLILALALWFILKRKQKI
jgi:hypothetical protein